MSAGCSGPPPESGPRDDEDRTPLERFRYDKTGPYMFVREFLTSVAVVAAIGLVLFAISGVWPPMVAVESGSMEPHMHKGDLVFVTEPGRLAPDAATGGTGIVTFEAGKQADYRTFGDYGSVIVYANPGRSGAPIIHRARFYVEEGENWFSKADKDHVRADSCAELLNCPAPHDGFVTKGDANPLYDQANGISGPVREEWITGIARVRIPYLGWVRLGVSGAATTGSHAGPVADAPVDHPVRATGFARSDARASSPTERDSRRAPSPATRQARPPAAS